MPKSVRTTRDGAPPLDGHSSTFEGFTSRWTIPRACAAPSASSTASPTSAVRCGDSGPSRLTTSASVRAGTYCMTR